MSRQWADDPILAKVKQAAMKRGNNGVRELTKAFMIMDDNKDRTLDREELKDGLLEWGVRLRDDEVKHLIIAFDRDGDGRLGLQEFLRGLRGGLNPRRRKVVRQAFQKFDKDGSGQITVDELKGTYSVANHPAVLKGEKTEEETLADFLACFEDKHNPDGVITWEEFEAYYAGVGANIDNDDYFDMMVTETWDLEDPTRPRFAPRKPREHDVFGNPVAPARPVAMHEVYPKPKRAPNQRGYDTNHMAGGRSVDPKTRNHELPHTWETTQRADYGYYTDAAVKFSKAPTLLSVLEKPQFTPTGDPVLDRVRKKILARAGKRGFKGLARILRIMDDNGNKKLSKEELKEGFATYRMSVTARELDTIYAYFDQDGNGSVSVTEFVRGVRGPMSNPKRVELVKLAYAKLDKTGDGIVNMQDVSMAYDAEKHPEVLDGTKTVEEVMEEFVGDWDKDGNGTITLDEFIEYYSDLSAGIDDDRYFELMIRNAWHISGGSGCTENTSNRRVLVVHMDGSQEVVEIKDDLGLRADDVPGMVRRLKKQGVKDIKRIELSF
eukprot:TRINITY_DN39690_c0_g1_i1.p1 TRINITY_DN39690_c0_g1~~TRINITY_DN39690_c0_g1_i1.p1  ORF type:complete len:573 (+),score=206.27 TRINITY_DN39690_c0_g1_i1:70-1719(+)